MEWERAAGKRLSRRSFLGASSAAVGAAGLVALGCGDGSNQGGTPTVDDEGSPIGPAPTATRPSGVQQGETLRYSGYVASDGVFDPHRTQAGPFYGQQALVMSRLLAYEDQSKGSITVDLAEKIPEHPDATTYVFTLNKSARWHEGPPLNGRSVTAEDVKFSIERQLADDPTIVRRGKWTNVDAMEVQDASHLTIRLKAPYAATDDLFAGVTSFIVAPESVADGRAFGVDTQPGSGPFRWVGWSEGRFASVGRNPTWHGGNGRPFLNGVTLQQPRDADDIEAGLRTRNLDVAFVGAPTARRLTAAVPSLKQTDVVHSLFYGMRFFVQQAPFNDPRLRHALTVAIDRRDMLQQFFDGSGEVNPWISQSVRWSLPQSELATVPGYRTGQAGRAQDIVEAQLHLAAYMSEKDLPAEPLTLLVPDDAERNLRIGEVMKRQLLESIGLAINVTPLPIADLSRRLLEGSAPWAAAPDNGWVDLDDWVYPYFHSSGTKNSFPLRDSELDALIESQRSELEEAKRREIGYQIQRKLQTLNVAANFVSERVIALSWPYVRDFPLDVSDGYQHRFADTWIDQGDSTFKGR